MPKNKRRKAQQRSLLRKVVVSGVIGVVLILGTLPMMIGVDIPGWPMFLHNAWLQLVLATPVYFGVVRLSSWVHGKRLRIALPI